MGLPLTPENKISLRWRQYIVMRFHVKFFSAQRNPASGILIKQIRTFSYYYSSLRPIILALRPRQSRLRTLWLDKSRHR